MLTKRTTAEENFLQAHHEAKVSEKSKKQGSLKIIYYK